METLWSTFWTCSTIDGSDLDNALRFGITGQLGLTSVSAYVEYEPENVHIFAPSGEPGARRAGYEAIRMICKGQAPKCAGWNGRSPAPLHCGFVRGDQLNCRSSIPTVGSTTKLQHFPDDRESQEDKSQAGSLKTGITNRLP
jgi:hypothetical protein